ncbi:MAG: hypothetical protein ACKVYV_03600 [Limisphaerales bacterium]
MNYADTSAMVALFWAADVHARTVLPAWRARRDRDLAWNPLHQLEAEHCLRQVKDRPAGAEAWQAYRAAEGSFLRGLALA